MHLLEICCIWEPSAVLFREQIVVIISCSISVT